jgi:spore coat polysaccharide biosynthesis protein SpsF
MSMSAQRRRTVAVVQARMGSTRLPGKVLQDVGGRPLLALVLERASRIAGVDELAVATSELATDDPVADLARRLGVRVVRGSELDVLDRYATAAASLEADLVVRITSDCPLVDPAVIDRLLAFRAAGELDYAAVLTGAVPAEGRLRFPDGLDTEVLRASVLAEASREATAAYDREHVTPFIKARPRRFRIGYLEAEQELGDERWTVDHPEDLAFVRAVVARLDDPVTAGLPDILAVLADEPELRALNAAVPRPA